MPHKIPQKISCKLDQYFRSYDFSNVKKNKKTCGTKHEHVKHMVEKKCKAKYGNAGGQDRTVFEFKYGAT